MQSGKLVIRLNVPSQDTIDKIFYSIVRTKANNEDTFINDGGRRNVKDPSDKAGVSYAYWYVLDEKNG